MYYLVAMFQRASLFVLLFAVRSEAVEEKGCRASLQQNSDSKILVRFKFPEGSEQSSLLFYEGPELESVSTDFEYKYHEAAGIGLIISRIGASHFSLAAHLGEEHHPLGGLRFTSEGKRVSSSFGLSLSNFADYFEIYVGEYRLE